MRMALLILILHTVPAAACSFCSDAFARRQSLRHHYAESKVVLAGQLRNPKPNTDGIGGTTEFHIREVLKGQTSEKVVTIPRYIPLIGATPSDYVFFCGLRDGALDPFHGLAAGAPLVEYLKEAAKLDVKNSPDVLGFFFKHLESADEAIAADAFVEFARAGDAEIAAAAALYDRGRLRAWIADAAVPEERLGVYALLLGLCGNADDAAWLTRQLAQTPRPERFSANLGGVLAGLTILDPNRGWTLIHQTLGNVESPLTDKLSVVGCLRYFQATRPKETREQVLHGCRVLLSQPDLADMAIDDLRRWGWWEHTSEILALYPKATSPLLKRGIARYALACPDAEAKQFIDRLRVEEPKLLERVQKK